MSGTLFFAYKNLCFSVCKMLALKNSFGLRSSLWCLYLCLCLWVKCGSNSAEYSTYLSSETPELLSECEMRDEWWALCTSEFIRPDSAVCDPVPLKAMYAHAIILPLLPFIPCFLFITFGSMRHTKPFSTLFSSWLSDWLYMPKQCCSRTCLAFEDIFFGNSTWIIKGIKGCHPCIVLFSSRKSH